MTDMNSLAMCVGYTLMAIGAFALIGVAAYYAAYLGNMAHWKIVGHLGGYKALMEFKKWRDEREAEAAQSAGEKP